MLHAVEDVVDHRRPFGVLGRAAHAALVRRERSRTSDRRARIIGERSRPRDPLERHDATFSTNGIAKMRRSPNASNPYCVTAATAAGAIPRPQYGSPIQ